MIKNVQDLKLVMNRYCQFFDSVITSILVSFNGNCSIEFILRCRDLNNEQKLVHLRFIDVQSWSFLSLKREASEVITEGVRIELLNNEWLVDFGDDPDVELKDDTWTKETSKWIIAKGIEVLEK